MDKARSSVLTQTRLNSKRQSMRIKVQVVTNNVSTVLRVSSAQEVSLQLRANRRSVLLLNVCVVGGNLLTLRIRLSNVNVVNVVTRLRSQFSLSTSVDRQILNATNSRVTLIRVRKSTIKNGVRILMLRIQISVRVHRLIINVVCRQIINLVLCEYISTSQLLSISAIRSSAIVRRLVVFPCDLLRQIRLNNVNLHASSFVTRQVSGSKITRDRNDEVRLDLLIFLFEERAQIYGRRNDSKYGRRGDCD